MENITRVYALCVYWLITWHGDDGGDGDDDDDGRVCADVLRL